jgi:hypothetical protein
MNQLVPIRSTPLAALVAACLNALPQVLRGQCELWERFADGLDR